jgi:hypothetical protein
VAPAASARRRSSALGAWADGWGRTLRASWLTLGLISAVLLFTVPLVHFGHLYAIPLVLSRALLSPATLPGVGGHWAGVWLFGMEPASGVMGPMALASGWVRLPAPVDWPTLASAVGSLLLWTFLSGGVVDRLARGRPTGSAGFFAACGRHVGRLTRLTALALGAMWVVLRVAPGLPYWLLLLLLATIHLTTDYARVRLVVEDRLSAIGGVLAALRFMRRRPVRVLLLWALSATVGLFVMWATPDAGARLAMDPTVRVGASALGLLVLVWWRLAMMASEIAFFQTELAHAEYTAAPWPVWPDSPSVEAIDNFLDRVRAADAPRGGR